MEEDGITWTDRMIPNKRTGTTLGGPATPWHFFQTGKKGPPLGSKLACVFGLELSWGLDLCFYRFHGVITAMSMHSIPFCSQTTAIKRTHHVEKKVNSTVMIVQNMLMLFRTQLSWWSRLVCYLCLYNLYAQMWGYYFPTHFCASWCL